MDNKKYDLWSDGYGATTNLLNDKDEYPFAGYATLLNEVYNMVRESDAKKILDVGFGTGIIAKKLYADGYELCGVDSSEQMVEAGKEYMPKAKLVMADYTLGLPLRLTQETYDMVISTYAFHHLDHYEQDHMIHDMLRQLNPGGKIIIGGLGFETMDELKALRKQNKDTWMYSGMYLLYDELDKIFSNVTWTKISKCAGIITITK